MKKVIINSLPFIAVLLFCAAFFGLPMLPVQKPAGELRRDDPFDQPYSVTILGDHQVQLASKSDTIILLLENSGTFADEYVVFIDKK